MVPASILHKLIDQLFFFCFFFLFIYFFLQALGGTIAALAQILSIVASGSGTQDKDAINSSANIFFTSALTITIFGLLGYISLFYTVHRIYFSFILPLCQWDLE